MVGPIACQWCASLDIAYIVPTLSLALTASVRDISHVLNLSPTYKLMTTHLFYAIVDVFPSRTALRRHAAQIGGAVSGSEHYLAMATCWRPSYVRLHNDCRLQLYQFRFWNGSKLFQNAQRNQYPRNSVDYYGLEWSIHIARPLHSLYISQRLVEHNYCC